MGSSIRIPNRWLPMPNKKHKSGHGRRHLRRIVGPRAVKPGARPGVVKVAEGAQQSSVSIHAYRPAGLEVHAEASVPDAARALQRESVVWVNVDGLGDAKLIEDLGELFKLHPLALEDVANSHQRAKVDDFGDHLFLTARMPRVLEGSVVSEQISLFLGEGFVLTFQETRGDCFDGIRQRLQREGSRIRQSPASYLAYALLDALVDSHFPVLESIGDTIETLEREIFEDIAGDPLNRIYDLKRDLLLLRRGAWPMRDVLSTLLRDTEAFDEHVQPYLRDCFDHVLQVIDLIETYRELIGGLLDVHLSQVSNRLNEVMKVLTIIATIFIPLGFIAGVYGMNFNTEISPWNLPELNWVFGYPFALGLMGLIAIGLLFFFRRKGWLGRPR